MCNANVYEVLTDSYKYFTFGSCIFQTFLAWQLNFFLQIPISFSVTPKIFYIWQ